MESTVSKQIVFAEGTKEKLESFELSVLPDGTVSYRGEVATPAAINPDMKLEKLDALVVSQGNKEGEFVFSYLFWPLECNFLLEVFKDQAGNETLHFYVKEIHDDISV